MVIRTATVPLIDEATGRLPDQYAPAAALLAAQTAVDSAATATSKASAAAASAAAASSAAAGVPAAVNTAVTGADIPGKVATQLALQAGALIKGTGFPNGVVAAPVGTLYSDTAVTNGASLWQKISGTGNTGWRIVCGDTGARNIVSLFSTDVTPIRCILRRTTDRVDATLALSINAPAGQYLIISKENALPFGWRPWSYHYAITSDDFGNTQRLDVNPDGTMVFYKKTAGYTAILTAFSWAATSQFPDTSPGTN